MGLTTLWTVALTKAGSALLLALAALGISRWVRRPEAAHALWLVVLLDLLAPPVIGVGVLPRGPVARATVESTGTLAIPIPGTGADLLPEASAADLLDLGRPGALLAGLWIAGACFVLLLTLARAFRFHRLLAAAEDAPRELQEAAATLARKMGLARCPPLRIVPARISPMLRPRIGGPEVLFPRGLLTRLQPAERDAILAHEFAHVRRRDHWVRWVELLASCLFFWHPAVWWARPRLHRAEERCCDAEVVRALPELAGSLARGLVSTVEFLNPTPEPLPCLASGVLGVEDLKERLVMILKPSALRPLSPLTRLALSAAAATTLLVFPTRASEEAAKPDCPTLSAEQALQQRLQTEELQRERLAADLERARAHAQSGDQGAARRQYEELIETQQQAELEAVRQRFQARRLQLELEAERVQAEMARAQRQMELARIEAVAEDSALRGIQRRIEALMQGAARLNAQGRSADLENLSRRLDELRRDVERTAEAAE